MKKWIIIVLSSALAAVFISMIEIDVTSQRQVIYIKGGETILADSVKQTDQFVFFETDGKSGMFMNDDVTSVGSIEVKKKTPLLAAIDRKKRRIMSNLGFNATMIRIVDGRLLIFLTLLAGACGLMALLRKMPNLMINLDRSSSETADTTTDKASHFGQEEQETSDLRDIALFFLGLYKLQKGMNKDAPARFSMTADSTSRKMKVFELGIKGSSDWLTRRMSVGPLGEETGSKSKCFYVIYDTHMVVKIPPSPITDMEKYVAAIRREVQIAAHLAPIACIVPMVSVVLNKVKSMPYESSLNQEQLEKQYIRLVEVAPEYQEYLKIGDRFAFFMELTNSFFLGRVIKELHLSKDKTGDEIREAPEVPWDQEAFTIRYGLESLPIFEEIQTLYQLCENEAKRVCRQSDSKERIHTFQIKNWFLSCIAEESLSRDDKSINADLLTRIENSFAAVFKSNQKTVDDLNLLLRSKLAQKAFTKSRQQIENIASNLLRLLCLLKEKRIALRDLKPDNLFLDANPDDYPVFLNSPEDFSIGVIDVETAISLVADRDGNVAQPLLGGTPLYATPLHLMKNRTIAANFGNVAEALHLQDWFASIAIIFKAITGRNLFSRSARSFPTVLKILKASRNRSDPDEATVKGMGRTFWSAAATDIKTSLALYSDVLNQVRLSIPDGMISTIKLELVREETCLNQAIGKHVSFSPLFKSEKNRAFLLNASSEAIVKQVARWQDVDKLPDQHRQLAPQMVAFLSNLNRLKQGIAEKRQALAALDSPPYQISAYSLIEAMFQITFRAMYKSRWDALPPSAETSSEQAAVEDNRSMVTTILNDN